MKLTELRKYLIAVLTFVIICLSANTAAIKGAEADIRRDDGNISQNRLTHNAYIDDNDVLWMWGSNEYGQLGIGMTDTEKDYPIIVMKDVKEIFTDDHCSFAIKNDGSLWSWGEATAYGILGNGGAYDRIAERSDGSIKLQTTPVNIMEDVASFSFDSTMAAAVKTDGSLWVWGFNITSALGNPNFYNEYVERIGHVQTVPVKLMDDVAEVTVTNNFSAAIKKDASLWMWGEGYAGCLGIGGWTSSDYPVKVMDNVAKVYLNNQRNPYSAAIKKDDSLWMWGSNRWGQLGNNGAGSGYYCNGCFAYLGTPVKVMDNVKYASISGEYCAAVKNDGTLWTWGGEEDGKTTDLSVPVKRLENVKTAEINNDYDSRGELWLIKNDDSYWFWGSKGEPVKAADNARYVDIESGWYVPLSDGTMQYCDPYKKNGKTQVVFNADGSTDTIILSEKVWDTYSYEEKETISANADGDICKECLYRIYSDGRFIYSESVETDKTTSFKEYHQDSDGHICLWDYSSKETTITVPSSVTIDGRKYTITEIAGGAFEDCPNVTRIKIGKNIESIGAEAFENLSNLEVIVINPKKLKEIAEDAFYGLDGVQIKIKAGKKRYKEVLKMVKESGISSEIKIVRVK